MRRAAAWAAVLWLTGCGGEQRAAPGSRAPATQVTVAVRPEGPGGPVRERIVGCDDPVACRRLRRADFRPPRDPVACTQIFGGPGTARVAGRVDGRPVDASFSLEDGCAIARWKRFSWLLGAPPTGA